MALQTSFAAWQALHVRVPAVCCNRLSVPALRGSRSLAHSFLPPTSPPTVAIPISSPWRILSIMGGHGSTSAPRTEASLHEFTVKDIDGNDVQLSKYKGKALLVVNVASACGLTAGNYKELSELYTKYKDQGLEILAFPSNQFGGQEPGTNAEIKEFACSRYKAEFPIFDKVDVNGPNTTPVYQFLKASKGGTFGDNIKWNFGKFLVDKDGHVVSRYAPTTSPLNIEKDIKKVLAVGA
eukprot:TRINITY_DN27303_c0_g1_i1.p1 TRINITY_DN27303_c0_g1~~TRINITY_DN27303_c0_g1_i1.p1  ORF type:complete len:238 (+),score=42.15 TRINITY_DN27303_c0_g1_i1:105-818(+)